MPIALPVAMRLVPVLRPLLLVVAALLVDRRRSGLRSFDGRDEARDRLPQVGPERARDAAGRDRGLDVALELARLLLRAHRIPRVEAGRHEIGLGSEIGREAGWESGPL